MSEKVRVLFGPLSPITAWQRDDQAKWRILQVLLGLPRPPFAFALPSLDQLQDDVANGRRISDARPAAS